MRPDPAEKIYLAFLDVNGETWMYIWVPDIRMWQRVLA